MYRLLKIILKASEYIGAVEKVKLDRNSYQGDYIEIYGSTKDNKRFCLELRVNDDENS